ncbi:MAG: hypothetical protein MMC33_005185 [Icmadophila ericetorum]|nr:hypothetical protein [Icmadophila ericetorum]
MAQPISSLVKASLGTFYNLLESFQFEDVQNGVHGDEIALSRLSDELGRLRVLPDTSRIKDQNERLLNSLQLSLGEIQDMLADQSEDVEQAIEDPNELEELYNEIRTIIDGLYQLSY